MKVQGEKKFQTEKSEHLKDMCAFGQWGFWWNFMLL